MCLLLISYNQNPFYKLIIAANRDEFYSRPALPASFWNNYPFLLAGKDVQAGGSWLGITKAGKFAAITNYRDPKDFISDKPSRGKIVTDFLSGNITADDYARLLIDSADNYNGYNLIFGEKSGMFYFSNKTKDIIKLLSGTFALSNHLLDTPWPKVERIKSLFNNIVAEGNLKTDLFGLLSDTYAAPDEMLPATGIPLEVERALSPIFVSSPVYGTRSSTVILIDNNDNVQFIEKSLNNLGKDWETREFNFKIGHD